MDPVRLGRPTLFATTVLALALAGCASENALRDGQALLDQGRYEEGLARLHDAAAQAPGEPRYRAALALQQERAVASLLAQAERQRTAGESEAAAETYRRVLRLSPRNARATDALGALDQRRNVEEMQKQARAAFRRGDLELAEKQLAGVLALDPNLSDAQVLRREIDLQHARTASPYPRLRTRFTRPVTLEFRDANLKMVLDVLSRTTGINFIVDKDVRPDLKATIFVRQVAVEDALDLLLSQSQLEKKVLNDNTVIVYPATPAKLREYQDWVIRTFFITNMDVKQAQTLIRTMLKTKDLFVDEKLNALTMRDSPDAVRLAEKLLQAQDQAEAEVVLEVELLDVSRDRFLDLGIQWPSTFTVLAPNGGAAALLSDLHGPITDNRIGIDRSLQARAKSLNNDVNTLASPRIRVRNKDKAKIHIGDRIPVVNATSVPSTQGPVITETVQYLDTGIKLEVEPTIYQSDEVAIKLSLEVSDSQDAGRTNSGTTLVRVKTSNASTSLRLKNGETQILAGLIRNDHAANADQVPGLGDIPGLGRLFGQHDDSWKKRELVLSITPRIVRNTPYLPPHMLEYGSGTESGVRSRPLSLQDPGRPGEDAVTLTAPPGESAPVPPPPVVGSARGATLPMPPRSAGTTAPANLPPPPPAVITPPDTPVSPAPLDRPVTGIPAPLTLALEGDSRLKVGDETLVTVLLKATQPVISTALQIGFDPKVLKVTEVVEGELLRSDGVVTTYSSNTDETTGRVFVGVSRPTGGPGMTAEGPLVQLKVQALAPSSSSPLKVLVFSGIGPGNRLQPAALPAALDLAVTEP
ncbi:MULTISPECIES: secretin and TonB N-terminal domain-containing protein [Ramlibacter]|uniref:Secretion type II protein n=1 Tax=Ramlibacter pinisoli TaxID=2682844 RepID=A0A6N8IXQ3_9BURK|nr:MULTISPECIES: secretin and TonB N-terminal domain-containing protein [Ramlibacter]MBA2961849.1 secretin and TonB N-terminal domain-containing protein [Ramlibacter sp. CGMCC 1.13660]MVQ31791.1 secretion type II protein [Ramlibacter pinisoli]